MGDEKDLRNVIALRVVASLDGMTADWVRLPYRILEHISNRIINEVRVSIGSSMMSARNHPALLNGNKNVRGMRLEVGAIRTLFEV